MRFFAPIDGALKTNFDRMVLFDAMTIRAGPIRMQKFALKAAEHSTDGVGRSCGAGVDCG